MRGVVKTERREGAIEVRDVDRPEPGADEAIVEVAYAGLCGSDLGIYKFKDAFEFMDVPRVLGHEYAGTVVETGDRVSRVAVGDRVAERPIRACWNCEYCEAGHHNLCRERKITGVHYHGAFTDYVAVPERQLHHLPDDMPLAQASTIEPTSVASRAVQRLSRVSAGDEVLVEGPGPIGLLTAQIADAQGGRVLVSGVGRDVAVRLALAEDLGLDTLNVEADSLTAAADERTGGRGFDVVFDATGHPSGLESAVDVVTRAGQIVMVGVGGRTELDYSVLLREELDVQCSYASDWTDFDRAIRQIQHGDVQTEPMADSRFSIEEAEDAFQAALNAETVKVRFELDGAA